MNRADWLSVAAQAEIEGNDPLAEFYRKLAQADRADAERTARLSVPFEEREV